MRALALRDRLAAAFALALVSAYAVIAVCAVLVVDRAITRSIDGRLSTVAEAIFTIAGDERDEIDGKDRQQFANIVSDASGAVVVATDGRILLGTTSDIPPWAAAAIGHEPVGSVFTVTPERHALRAVVERRRSHQETSTVVVWQSLRIVTDVEQVVGLVLGGCGIIVAVGGYAVGRQIATRGLLPLSRITSVVADIAAHDLSRRVGPQPHADELGQLAATFDRMLDRLQSAFERQRQFTADASHDLRAPLATLRAEVELALRRERTNAEYRTALEEIAVDAGHLERLIDALLAAARADGGDVDLQPLDLSVVAGAAVTAIEPFAQSKHVRIDADLLPGGMVLGEHDLLQRSVLAALHNAVKYTPAGSAIRVRVTGDMRAVQLSVTDAGPGFSDVALKHAFERFWREDTARGRSGSGLGLAIAQGIVQRCGGEITLDNVDGGARVTLGFPALAPTLEASGKPPVR